MSETRKPKYGRRVCAREACNRFVRWEPNTCYEHRKHERRREIEANFEAVKSERLYGFVRRGGGAVGYV